MRVAWIIILFLVSSAVAQTSITFGGYLYDLGNFLTTSYTTDTNTFLVGVIAGGLVLLQAPLIVIYKIIAEVISIVALSLFINFLGERMGFGSFIPFIRDALPREDSSIFDSPYGILPNNENVDVRSYDSVVNVPVPPYVDKRYVVSVYPDGHEIKTVRTFQEPGKGTAESRRNHRKMNSRRRDPYSSWRRGRISTKFRNQEDNNFNTTKNNKLSTEYSHNFFETNDRTNHPNDRYSLENNNQNSRKVENKLLSFGIANTISDIGNEFLKSRVNSIANNVLESDKVRSFKKSVSKNVSNFVLKLKSFLVAEVNN